MAVAPMTKAQVVIHGAESDTVVKRIYDLGLIQAIEVVETTGQEDESLHGVSDGISQQIADNEAQLREVVRSLEILSMYDDSKREIIENFVSLKQRIPLDEIESIRKNFDALEISRQLMELAEKLKHLEDQEGWLQDDRELLHILAPIPFPLSDLRSISRVKTMIGRLRKEGKDTLEQELAAYEDSVFWEEITEQGQFIYMFIMYYPVTPREAGTQENNDIQGLLERHGFDSLDLSRYSLRIPEEIQRIVQQLEELRTQIDDVKENIKSYLQYKEHFKVIEDFLTNEIQRHKDLQNFAETEKVYFVEGWMKQDDKSLLEKGLHDFKESTAIFYTDADEDDETVPVILENKPLIQPFEIITRMFGMPKYNEPDPTPILAPFFALFFGLCLTDAGYGIMLSLFMVWLMRKYVLDAGTVQLARLLCYGGISTIVCGALTGGWFGNIFDSLPSALGVVTAVKNAFIVIDPMKEPIAFLVLSLVLGYLQVCYGIFLKMKHRMEKGDSQGAFIDEGIWLVFINSLFFWTILAVSGIGHLLIGQGLILMFKGLALASGVARIWLHDRENPKVVMRIFSGLYSLYDIVGIFSDVLSYSRLLALGLATGVIAMIIDMLAMMTSGIPGIGFIIGIIIFVFGHVFNLVINTLGAFIHSGRLQFVEFFSKFFEAGGKKYKPFKFESKYFEITE
jgi:V/A-type H+-transporting ATPase subunit I